MEQREPFVSGPRQRFVGNVAAEAVQLPSPISPVVPSGPTLGAGSPAVSSAAAIEAFAVERELTAARRTLWRSTEVANSFTVFGLTGRRRFERVPAEGYFWFSKVYEIITYEELAAVNESRDFPAYMLTFIPIFYELYDQALQRHLSRRSGVPSHWQVHFDIAGATNERSIDLDQVVKCVVSGVKAHIQGDMTAALVGAYRQYRARYPSIAPEFDEIYPDYFQRDPVVFERVPARFFMYLSTLALPVGSVEIGQYLFGAGNELIRGLPIKDIVAWRDVAWNAARTQLNP